MFIAFFYRFVHRVVFVFLELLYPNGRFRRISQPNGADGAVRFSAPFPRFCSLEVSGFHRSASSSNNCDVATCLLLRNCRLRWPLAHFKSTEERCLLPSPNSVGVSLVSPDPFGSIRHGGGGGRGRGVFPCRATAVVSKVGSGDHLEVHFRGSPPLS